MIWIELTYNLSLLVALSVVSGFVDGRWPRTTRRGRMIQGAVFGAAAMIGMMRPFVLDEGVVFDGRSVMISLGALFFGPLAGAVTCLMTIPLRILQGGSGALTGVLVILSSAVIGVFFYKKKLPLSGHISVSTLYFFGILVHLAMLALMFTLPWGMALDVLKAIALPVMIVYPLATVLVGKILSDQAVGAEAKKALQESLFLARESEERFRSLVEGAPDAVFIQADSRFVYVNPAALRLFGADTPEQLLGSPVMDRFHPSVREKVKQRIHNLNIKKERVPLMEEIYLRLDGSEVPVEVAAVPTVHEGSNGAIVFVRDISERKKVEADLAQIEWMLSKKPEELPWQVQEYGDLTELNSDGLISKTVDRELLRKIASDYLDLLGTSSAVYEINGDYAFGIFASGWCSMMDEASRRLCETDDNAEALSCGKWLCHESCWHDCSMEAIKRGAPVDIECAGGLRLYAVPIFARGNVIGAINFGYGDPPKDLAKLRELAEKYQLEYDDLVREVYAYDSRPPYIIEMAKNRLQTSAWIIGALVEVKLAEEERERLRSQLNQAQKMESIGRLAGGVAHDFNNLLMGIMGYAELCREKVGREDPIREWLDEITHESERSAALTRQLLAFARKQTVAPQVLNLNEAVDGMLKMLRRLIGEDIDLVWHPASVLWEVMIDPGQLDQILANLCVNARDAINGVGKVTIETAKRTFDKEYCSTHDGYKHGEFAMLEVSDDGHGMDSATLENVFEPFFTTKTAGEGTGLGLATVYGIVKQNDGFINVYSEPGKGTTFRIYLPRVVDGCAVEEKEALHPVVGGNETIMLVEDEPSVRKTICIFLEQLGYTVLVADCPEDALRLAVEHVDEIDLLITDVVMPGMNGRDMAAKMLIDAPDLKVLYMSGYTANVIAHHGILEKGVNFMSKPVTRDELALKVRLVLDSPFHAVR